MFLSKARESIEVDGNFPKVAFNVAVVGVKELIVASAKSSVPAVETTPSARNQR